MRRVEDFFWYLQSEKRFSDATVSAYKADFTTWEELGLNLESDRAPEKQRLTEVLSLFANRGFTSSTEARKIAALRAYCRYRSLFSGNWASLLDELPPQKEELPLPKALSLGDVKKFLNFEAKSKRELRNKALLELIYACGLRVSEATELTWDSFDEEQGVLRVLGKGSKERFVPYSERAMECLERYREEVWPEWVAGALEKHKNHVFLSHLSRPLSRMAVWKIFQKRSLESGVDDVHPHVLRHSFATHLLQGGADVRLVQALVGHASLDTTERYLKVDDATLQEAFRNLHPLSSFT